MFGVANHPTERSGVRPSQGKLITLITGVWIAKWSAAKAEP